MFKIVIRAVAILAFLGTILVYFEFTPENITFQPEGYSAKAYSKLTEDSQASEVTIPVAGEKIDAWHFKVPNSKYVVLLSHGNGRNVPYIYYKIHTFEELGTSVFAYDYEGYGKSSGHPSLKNLLRDAEAAYSYLVDELHYRPEQIILYGESCGGGVTGELLKHHEARAAIFDATFTSLSEEVHEAAPIATILYPWFPDLKLETIKVVAHLHLPILIIHSRNDEIINWHQAERLFKAANQPKQLRLLEHSQHAIMLKPERKEYKKFLAEFLESLN